MSVLVLRVGRYIPPQGPSFAVDMVVMDGSEETIVCSLSGDLSAEVEKGSVEEGDIVRLDAYNVWLNELEVGGGEGTIRVTKMVTTRRSPFPMSLCPIEAFEGEGGNKMKEIEIDFEKAEGGGNRFFLSQYSDQIVASSSWECDDVSLENTCLTSLQVDNYTPKIVETLTTYSRSEREGKRTKNLAAPLVGRILAISPLNYFGKFGGEHPYPINFQMVFGDASNSLSVSVWNSLCQLYYPSLQVGDMIVITDYCIRGSQYANALTCTFLEQRATNTHENNLEIHINAQNPHGFIYKITGGYEGPSLPSFQQVRAKLAWFGAIYSSVKSIVARGGKEEEEEGGEIGLMEERKSSPCMDVAGIVSYAGSPFTIVSPVTGKVSLWKWIKVWVPRSQNDGTEDNDGEEVAVKLGASSQLNEWARVAMNDVILLTNLRIHVYRTSQTDKGKGRFYLYSTPSSRVATGQCVPKMMYETLQDWVLDPQFTAIGKKNIVWRGRDGGLKEAFYLFPTADDIESYEAAFPEVKLVRLGEVEGICEGLRCREAKTVLVQGRITSLFSPPPPSSSSSFSPSSSSPASPSSQQSSGSQPSSQPFSQPSSSPSLSPPTQTSQKSQPLPSPSSSQLSSLAPPNTPPIPPTQETPPPLDQPPFHAQVLDINATTSLEVIIPLPFPSISTVEPPPREWPTVFPSIGLPSSVGKLFRGEIENISVQFPLSVMVLELVKASREGPAVCFLRNCFRVK